MVASRAAGEILTLLGAPAVAEPTDRELLEEFVLHRAGLQCRRPGMRSRCNNAPRIHIGGRR